MAITARKTTENTTNTNTMVCEVGEYQGTPTLRVGPEDNYKASLSAGLGKWSRLFGKDKDGDNILRMVTEFVCNSNEQDVTDSISESIDEFCLWWAGVRGLGIGTEVSQGEEDIEPDLSLDERLASTGITVLEDGDLVFYFKANQRVALVMDGNVTLSKGAHLVLSQEEMDLVAEHAASLEEVETTPVAQPVAQAPAVTKPIVPADMDLALRRQFQNQVKVWKTATESQKTALVELAYSTIDKQGIKGPSWTAFRDALNRFGTYAEYADSAK